MTADSGATLTSTGNTYKDTSGTIADDQGTAFDASKFYSYKLDKTADVPSKVQANAGPRESVCS